MTEPLSNLMSRVDLRGELLKDGLETGAISATRKGRGRPAIVRDFVCIFWLCRYTLCTWWLAAELMISFSMPSFPVRSGMLSPPGIRFEGPPKATMPRVGTWLG